MLYSGLWKLVITQLVNKYSEKHRIFVRLTEEEVKCLPIILNRVRAKQIAEEEPVKQCYEWTVGQLMVESWARRLREELDPIWLDYLWQIARAAEIRTTCHNIMSDAQKCKDRRTRHKQIYVLLLRSTLSKIAVLMVYFSIYVTRISIF
jgi:hypothetical protein